MFNLKYCTMFTVFTCEVSLYSAIVDYTFEVEPSIYSLGTATVSSSHNFPSNIHFSTHVFVIKLIKFTYFYQTFFKPVELDQLFFSFKAILYKTGWHFVLYLNSSRPVLYDLYRCSVCVTVTL